ncbi:MAG: hypothetical protein ACE5GN_05885 [Waddliaceae bacterium]
MGEHKYNFKFFLLLVAFVSSLSLYSIEDISEYVWIKSDRELFENEAPSFDVETSSLSPKQIHWQISIDPDFIEEDLIFEDTCPFSKKMILHSLAQGLLIEKDPLFFRARVSDEERWSPWSTPATFFIIRPEAAARNPKVSEAVWNQVSPYFLPMDHPIRPVLDRIFSKDRVTLSLKSMKKAGFINPSPRKWTHLIVTKHPDVPGYVFKIFLDVQRYFKQKPEHVHWLERIHGAQTLEAEINKRRWHHIFKVPKKWIYPLPAEPSPPKAFLRKNFILVEEDMDIFDTTANHEKWKSNWVTTAILDAVYTLLQKFGLHDCAKPDNIPFSKDGRISFVDTQTLYQWPVLYKKLMPHLSPEMQGYWEKLTRD